MYWPEVYNYFLGKIMGCQANCCLSNGLVSHLKFTGQCQTIHFSFTAHMNRVHVHPVKQPVFMKEVTNLTCEVCGLKLKTVSPDMHHKVWSI